MHLALAFRNSGQTAAAEMLWRQVVASDPKCADAWNNLGNVLSEKQQASEAITCFQQAISLTNDFAAAHNNLGHTLGQVGRWEEAAFHCLRAVELTPDNSRRHVTLSMTLFLLGRYKEGWKHYEWRLYEDHLAIHLKRLGRPMWDGSRMQDETLLVHAEQGLGDTIHFLRYVPVIRKQSLARRILLVCHQPLLSLVRQNVARDVEVIAQSENGEIFRSFDRYVHLLSVPFVTQRFTPFPVVEPYLEAEKELREVWRNRLKDFGAFRVGVVWEGNFSNSRDRERSIRAELLGGALKLPAVTFFSLQMQPRTPVPENTIDLTNWITDFSDTAALMTELDLIISVDTASAHLAGALGKPVWTLLPFVPDWRWGLNTETTPWYPTMRLFRQSALGDWDSVIKRVAEELQHAITDRAKLLP